MSVDRTNATVGAMLLATGFASCGGDGAPLRDGAITGTYATQNFDPLYGVALDRYDELLDTRLEIQLSAEPIDCDHHIALGAVNPNGLFLVVRVREAAAGTYDDAYFEYDSLAASGSKQLGDFGSVAIATVDDDAIAGSMDLTIDDDSRPAASARGAFEVVRCRE